MTVRRAADKMFATTRSRKMSLKKARSGLMTPIQDEDAQSETESEPPLIKNNAELQKINTQL